MASSLLALPVWVVVIGKSCDQHLKSSALEITDGANTLADYQVDTANLALTNAIIGMGTGSGIKESQVT